MVDFVSGRDDAYSRTLSVVSDVLEADAPAQPAGVTPALETVPAAAESSRAAPFRVLPDPAPLAMPVQALEAAPAARPRLAGGVRVALSRILLLVGAGALAGLHGGLLTRVLGSDGTLTPLELLTIGLSVVLGAWLGFGLISASAGFVIGFARRGEAETPPCRSGASRTALLLPTYNEDPALVLAAAQAMAEEMNQVGLGEECDFFILSDTRDEAIAREEAAGFLRLRARAPDGPQIFYRRRAENIDRKAGNIADWVETYGGAYDYMVVLDADSLMSGDAVAELIARMDQDPGLGLLQTAPAILNAATGFARLQQFASRLYGPLFARGQQWWSGSEGNYWGHNAIIRVAAFAASARLPHLPGRRPFGGHIMSHDFVEAALLRRAGWAVRTLAELPGSYEESPPTLLDCAARDRRWCQGNLQHARVLKAAGLHWVSRMHLLCGILSYVAPLLWLSILVAGAFVWPAQHIGRGTREAREVTALAALALGSLAAPKIMALLLALRSQETRRSFGGAPLLIAGVLGESLASVLVTPIMMVMQSVAVFEVLLGRDTGWIAQDRKGAALTHAHAWRAHARHVLLGLGGAICSGLFSKYFLLWTSPVFVGLTLSALLSAHTSRPLDPARAKLFRTPEELEPPYVLLRALYLRRAYAAETSLRRRIHELFRHPAASYHVLATPTAWSELPLVA